ncbi:MAG: CinA family protein [Alphaproteobacteria bacterium]|nr:CinA family protein [Alphaproteobacteria bacterium]
MTDLVPLATALLENLRQRRLKVATAESCTGGLIAASLTEIAGSSDVVDRGFITYSNEAKSELLGVHADLIGKHGAVSEEVARAMAEGAIARSRADVAIAVTGIAGPGGATPTKPIGLVHLAVARRGGKVLHERHVFAGDRKQVRIATVERSFAMLDQAAGGAVP